MDLTNLFSGDVSPVNLIGSLLDSLGNVIAEYDYDAGDANEISDSIGDVFLDEELIGDARRRVSRLRPAGASLGPLGRATMKVARPAIRALRKRAPRAARRAARVAGRIASRDALITPYFTQGCDLVYGPVTRDAKISVEHVKQSMLTSTFFKGQSFEIKALSVSSGTAKIYSQGSVTTGEILLGDGTGDVEYMPALIFNFYNSQLNFVPVTLTIDFNPLGSDASGVLTMQGSVGQFRSTNYKLKMLEPNAVFCIFFVSQEGRRYFPVWCKLTAVKGTTDNPITISGLGTTTGQVSVLSPGHPDYDKFIGVH